MEDREVSGDNIKKESSYIIEIKKREMENKTKNIEKRWKN